MPDALDVSQDVSTLTALIDSTDASIERKSSLPRLREQHERSRAALLEKIAEFDDLYAQALRGHVEPEELTHGAEILLERAQALAEVILPGIDSLKQKLYSKLKRIDPEAREALQASLDIATGWLALYHDVREKLLKLAAERDGNAGNILRARPIEGEVDHGALSREFITKFPKLRAALAK